MLSDESKSPAGFLNPAFIFDLDGVIVNSELMWHQYAANFRVELYGEEILRKLGDSTIGVSLAAEYEMATRIGFALERSVFFERYERQAVEIYSRSQVTAGIDLLIDQLRALRFRIALVTASPPSWIDYALHKVSLRDQFDSIISLEARPDLRHKPYPDGYLEAVGYLRSRPETTLVLEDANPGIRAAKAAGALTIGFCGNLVPGYEQIGADVYADTMDDVVRIVKEFSAARG